MSSLANRVIECKRSSLLRRAVPWLALALCLLPLLVPYLRPGYQLAHDRDVPYKRVFALDQALAEGQVPPRWFPDFDGGYGSPYPSFYGMLFYYVAAGLSFLGLSIGQAVEVTAFLTFVGAAAAMFVLVRGLWGTASGLLAAALYSYAPYHLVNAFVRGAYSELTAFVWFPLILHALYRWLATGRRRYLLLGAFSIAGLLLTHNLMPLAFLPIGLVFPLLEAPAWKAASGDSHRRLAGLLWCYTLALLIAAFFLLPILLLRSTVRLDYFMQYDYHDFFSSLSDLFRVARQHSLTAEAGVLHVGAAALAGLLALLPLRSSARVPHRATIAGALVAGLAFLYMTTGLSAWIWDRVPPLRFMQFPWRLLAPAALFLSLAAGALPAFIGRTAAKWAVVAGLAFGVVFLHHRLIQIPERTSLQSLDTAAVRAEVWGTQDYRPRWSGAAFWRALTPPGPADDPSVLLPALDARLFAVQGPVSASEVRREGSQWTITCTATGEGSLMIPQFYYPGWRAWLDGGPVPVKPAANHGLVQVDVPPGNHQVRLAYMETPVHRLGDALTLVGLTLAGITCLWPFARQKTLAPTTP